MTPEQEQLIKEEMIEKVIPLIWANEDIEDYSLGAYSDDGLLELIMDTARKIAKDTEDQKHQITDNDNTR